MSDTQLGSSAAFDSSFLIRFIYKWWRSVIAISLFAAISSGVFSYLITPKFKSTVVVFPVSSNSISKALISDNFGNTSDIMEFGEEEQVEQLLQILNSDEIRERIREKYNLFEHYEIDDDAAYPKTEFYIEFKENVTFTKTPFMSVEISVLDKSPEIAANIANNIADLIDTVKNNMQKERAKEGLKIAKRAYLAYQTEIKFLEDSLKRLREKGVNDYESQSEVLNDAYAQAIVNGKYEAAKILKKQLDILAKYGGDYVSIRDQLEHEKKQLSVLKEKYAEAKIDAEEILPQKFTVSKAFPAEKKSYPIRWLIVLAATFSSFLLCIVSIIIMEHIRKFKYELSNKLTP